MKDFMGIVEAIKQNSLDIRLKYENRWLYWDDVTKTFVVLERKPKTTVNKLLIETPDEELAVEKLLS